MWTESNWPSSTPSVTMYLREAGGVDNAYLGAGIATTVVSVAAVVAVRMSYDRRLKQQ